MSSAANRGQFVWHELMTTDTAGAGDFYPRVAGWKTQTWEADNSYTLWVGDAGPLGGVMSLPQEATAPSHWMPYIGTNDVAATVAAARELGATVCKDTTRLPNGGSYAVLQDPQGATFAIHAAGAEQPEGSAEQSDFSWHELSTADLDAALRFYTELFGWEAAEKHDMGEIGFYQLFAREGRTIGGMYVTPPGMTPHWLSYVRVNDVDAATEAAKAGGGRIINGPLEVPGGDWIAQIIDPQGAAFAVHEITARSAAAPESKQAKPRKARAPKAANAASQARARPAAKAAVRAKPAAAKKASAASRKASGKAKAKAKGTTKAKAKGTIKAKAAAKRPVAKEVARSKRSKAKRAPARKTRVKAGRRVAKRKSARRVVRAKRRR